MGIEELLVWVVASERCGGQRLCLVEACVELLYGAGGACSVVAVAPWSFVKKGKVSSFSGPRVVRYVWIAESRDRHATAVTVL